jgi:hypothetical protein
MEMFAAKEVSAFKKPVTGKNGLVAWERLKKGGIVADSQRQRSFIGVPF